MNTDNPIDLLFGGMEKLGPGGDLHTRNVPRLLPKRQFHVIVDAGCGTGRQTLVLASHPWECASEQQCSYLGYLSEEAAHRDVGALTTPTSDQLILIELRVETCV